jgi:hypothetical protein
LSLPQEFLNQEVPENNSKIGVSSLSSLGGWNIRIRYSHDIAVSDLLLFQGKQQRAYSKLLLIY